MKKYLLSLWILLSLGGTALAAVQSVSCSSMGASCNECFKETSPLYTCNPNNPTCQKQAILGAYDTVTNTGNTNLVMYDGHEGTINFYTMQTSNVSWSQSGTIASMFQFPSAYENGRENFSVWPSASGYKLVPGATVRWIEFKPSAWLSPQGVTPGASRTSPAMRIEYIPRLYYSATSFINHKQCIFYYVRFCGDGTIDTDRGEQCDDGNMNSGDGCSNICQTETVTPVCTGLTVSPTTLTNGGMITYTCSGTNATSYSIIAKNPSGTIVASATNAVGSLTLPATPTGTYNVECYVNNQGYALDVCTKTIVNNGNTVTPQVHIDKRDANPADLDGVFGGNDSQTVYSGNAAVFKIRVTNTGTEDLKNIVLSDTMAPNCGGSMTLPSTIPGTWSGFVTGGSGDHTDTFLQPNEYFEYTCNRTNTTTNYTNTARVDAVGKNSNTPVDSTDPTPVIIQGVTNPTCDNLTLTTSGNTVYYNCSGSNVTNYAVQLNGAQIGTSATWSTTVGNGTHTFVCYVNNGITSQSCQKSVTINPEVTYPRIEVVKDDNDNRDDQQQIQIGGLAQFTILVRNPGPEPLDNISLSDQFAPECNRNASETVNMIFSAGNRDGRLDPGESFTYVCNRPGADQNTFPNNENRVCTSGRGTTSGNTVNACDTTRINFGSNAATCENINVAQNGNQVNVTCSPQGGYRMFLMQNGQVINTLQNPAGQFTFGATNPGTYTVVCLRDGDRTVQPNCQRNITIRENKPEGVCVLQSSAQYGGAPLYTNLSCRSTTGSQQCMIKIHKDGFLWKTLYACDTTLTMPERGVYDATCYLGDGGEEGCNTTIQVDVMTDIPTGPFLPLIIIVAISMGIYINYRRRKTV